VAAGLIIARKPPEATERQHKKLRRKASRLRQKTDPRTVKAAGFMMLLTSLSPGSATPEEVVRLYRMRWQVELAFKRLKSLGGFAALRAGFSLSYCPRTGTAAVPRDFRESSRRASAR
jgi:Transposase DDE domain